METLKFGTDGWRDIIADGFTLKNLSRATQAYAIYLHKNNAKKDNAKPTVVVGYDTRFNGSIFAERVAEVLASNNITVYLSEEFIPTPALSFAVTHYRANGGVMITASHNPPPYNGFKLKGAYGGTATQDIYKAVSELTNKTSYSDVNHNAEHFNKIQNFDIKQAYFEQLSKLINIDLLRNIDLKLCHDAMGGAATGWLKDFIENYQLGIKCSELHPEASPMFYGVNPEPIDLNLEAAKRYLQNNDCDLLVATDGDGDRLGAVLPDGRFFNSHQIFAVLIDLMHKKGYKGKIVKTFTVSRLIEKLAKQRDIEVIETPVGFKYIVDAMLNDKVLVGGEESGGIGVTGHIPERDGIANSLLLVEAMATAQKPLGELFESFEAETGWNHSYDRLDLHLKGNELKDAVMASLQNPPQNILNRQLESAETLDGVKLNLSDNAWLMFRPSGTEPVLRIYCEAGSEAEVAELLDWADSFVQSL